MAARGNRTVITPNRGVPVEGIIGAGITTAYPGTVMQLQPATALQGGRFTWEIYNRDVDGDRPAGPYIVLCEDLLQGKTMSDVYAAGDRAFGFVPWPGCELNLLWRDADTGTSTNDVAVGTIGIVDDATGTIIGTTGTVENEVCLLLEAISNLSGNTLGWTIWSGY